MIPCTFFARSLKICLLAFLSFLIIQACSTDVLPPSTIPDFCGSEAKSFELDVKPIILNSCAYSGCHVQGSDSGDFTSYNGILSSLENGKINSRALEIRDMPASYAPAGKPTSLTEEEIEILSCWIAQGFPDN